MSPVVSFIGKLHFVVLHFPIALLLGALFVEIVLRRRVPEEKRRDVVGLLLMLASAGALVTVASGLVHAAEEDFHGHALALLNQHRATGIATAFVSILCLIAFRTPKAKAAFLPLLAIASAMVLFTGHRGGELVHG